MTDFNTVEQSIQDAAPAELYTFVAPVKTWYLTSAENDVNYGGNRYVATTGSRAQIQLVDVGTDQTELVFEIPATHELVRTYANGLPPREIFATVKRFHPASGVALQIWSGFVTGVAFKGRMAALCIPSGTAENLSNPVPTVAAQRLCNHILYDGMCKIDPSTRIVQTFIASISPDGRTIGVGSLVQGLPGGGIFSLQDPRAVHGTLRHVASTEQRTITAQNVGLLTIQCPFPNNTVNVGDAIDLFQGCDHTHTTCGVEFSNQKNFGGHPFIPSTNLFYVGLSLGRNN